MGAMSPLQFTNPVFQRYWAARLRLANAYMAVAEATKTRSYGACPASWPARAAGSSGMQN